MFITSRALHQSLIIANSFLVTVAHVAQQSVELLVKDRATAESRFLVVEEGEFQEIADDIRIYLLGVPERPDGPGRSARLGIEAPHTLSIHRKEDWEASHGTKWEEKWERQ